MAIVTHAGRSHFVDLRERIEAAIRAHRGWYLFEGSVFIVAGILAIVLPGITAIGFELVIGTLLLISGLVQAASSVGARTHWWSLFSALISIVIGGMMLFYPMEGTVTLATMIAVFLAVEGVIELLLAFQFRPVNNWGWLLVSGIISLVLAVVLFAGWPDATVAFLGIMVGINLLLYGVSILGLAASTKRFT